MLGSQEGNVSIRDDPDQQVFTVTINNLTAGGSDIYCCGVNISGGSDVGDWVHLSVTDGVSTVGDMTVQRGGSVTIPCFYDDRYKTHVKYWCKGYHGDSCTPIVHSDSPQEGKVSVRDDPDQQVFTVTINSLTAGDSGTYFCGVNISGGSDVGDQVHLSVTDGSPVLSVDKQEVTGVEGDSVSVQCRYGNNTRQIVWCKFGGSCAAVNSRSLDGRPVLIRDDRVNRFFSVTVGALERKDTGWYWFDDGNLQIPVHITVKHADSVYTVSRVSAWRGGSVTIPCFYDDIFKTHLKYWCRGRQWSSCTPIVHSDSPQEGKVSIRDDPDQQVFTVTINSLTAGDSDRYWCGVNISGGSDVGDQVYLSVTDGVSTVGLVTVQRGGSVTIPCFYGDGYETHVKYWCRGREWSSCTPIVHSDSPQEGKVSIRDDPDQRVFTVIINNLTAGDSDRYWCGVKISGGSDVGDRVYLSVSDGLSLLSVDKQEVTGVEGDNVSVQCHYKYDFGQRIWCKIGGSCASEGSESLDGRPVLITDDRVNKVFSVTMRGLERKDTGWYWCNERKFEIPVHITVSQTTTATTSTELTIKPSAPGSTPTGANDKEQRWGQVLDAALKAETGVLYLICTIIAIQLNWCSCRKKGSNQREAEGGANTNNLAI
ncbi:polymeric immunoglobulin receptor-like isoform X2 [Paramormyrops kingsleyae]|uniref:polymeric immunoglobulin receptor-like isoform X2 n=1 Tax=Paramormyrops kingsleyae TaxID=1676925 RepID=UPI003B9708D7